MVVGDGGDRQQWEGGEEGCWWGGSTDASQGVSDRNRQLSSCGAVGPATEWLSAYSTDAGCVPMVADVEEAPSVTRGRAPSYN